MALEITITNGEEKICLTDFTVYQYKKRLDNVGERNKYLSKEIVGLELFGRMNIDEGNKEFKEVNKLSKWAKILAHEKNIYREVILKFTDIDNSLCDSMQIKNGFVVIYEESYNTKQENGEFHVFIREVDEKALGLDRISESINRKAEEIEEEISREKSSSIKVIFYVNGQKKHTLELVKNGFEKEIGGKKKFYSYSQIFSLGYRVDVDNDKGNNAYNKITAKINIAINGKELKSAKGYVAKEICYIMEPEEFFKQLGYKVKDRTKEYEITKGNADPILIPKAEEGTTLTNVLLKEAVIGLRKQPNTKVTYSWDKNTKIGKIELEETITFEEALTKAKKLTSRFEGAEEGTDGYDLVTGNNDGMGISLGCIQYNLGSGTLQPLLKEMMQYHGSEMERIFTKDHYNKIKKMLKIKREKPEDTYAAQVDWSIDKKNGIQENVNENTGKDAYYKIDEDWKKELQELGSNIYFKKLQDKYMVPYIRQTKEICKYYELKTERGVVFAFDVAVQNWGTDDKLGQLKGEVRSLKTEEDKLKRLTEQVVKKATNDPEATEKRKEAIANGSGTVNGEEFDLTSEKIDILYRKIEGKFY